MTKYFDMNIKSLLKNPYLIFWSILFIEFWVFMWAYVFGNEVPLMEEAIRAYTAAAYGSLLMLSLSSAAVTIASSLLYSSKSIRYVTKYTKLSPHRFLFENLLSSLVVLLAISMIMFTSVLLVFFNKFGIFVPPINTVGLLFSLLLGTLFVYALSLFLNLLIVTLRAPKSASFVSFLPLILGFTSYMALWIDFGNAVYFSPFNCITSICYYYFSGQTPPTGNFLMPVAKTLVNVDLALGSLIAWLALLILLDILLLRKMRGVGVEDIRIV